jgi:hypothetical protein
VEVEEKAKEPARHGRDSSMNRGHSSNPCHTPAATA